MGKQDQEITPDNRLALQGSTQEDPETESGTSWAERIAGWCHDFDQLCESYPEHMWEGRAVWCYLQARLYDTAHPSREDLYLAGEYGWHPLEPQLDIADPPLPDGVSLIKPHDR